MKLKVKNDICSRSNKTKMIFFYLKKKNKDEFLFFILQFYLYVPFTGRVPKTL